MILQIKEFYHIHFQMNSKLSGSTFVGQENLV